MRIYLFSIRVLSVLTLFFVLSPNRAHAASETVLVSANFDVSKCTTSASIVSCDPVGTVGKNVGILLSNCSTTPAGSVCSGAWTTLRTRDGYYFDASIGVTKSTDSAGIVSYRLTASVGPTMNGITVPHSTIDIYMNQGRLTDYVQFSSNPLNIGTIGPTGSSTKYTPFLMLGPAVFHESIN